jgi:hypothetical protein
MEQSDGLWPVSPSAYELGLQFSSHNARAYGHAAARAYAAYKNQTFLDYAVTVWNYGRNYSLTDADVLARTSVVKNFTIQESCQDGEQLSDSL